MYVLGDLASKLKMFKFLVCGFVVIACSIHLEKCQCKSIGQLMRNALIIPWVYRDFPNETCRVSFPIYNVRSVPGGEINGHEARKKAPLVRWNARKNALYTMMMISPDIWGDGNPQNNTYCEWDPWVVVNIPGHRVKKGNTVKNYLLPSKPRRDGIIYYVFLIFQQPEFLYFIEEAYDASPDTFRVNWFVCKYNLTGPVAGNFFSLVYPEFTTPEYYGPREIKLLGVSVNYTHPPRYRTKPRPSTITTPDPYYYHSSEYEDTEEDGSKGGKKKKD